MKNKKEGQLRIYEIIIDDIKKHGKGYSTITTSEIWKIYGINHSINGVRDKIQKLVSQGFLTPKYDEWIDNKFYNRVLYVGSTTN